MTKVFISGSRHISHLDPNVTALLDRIVHQRLGVLVGDANRADKAVQEYFASIGYERVKVFGAGTACRNNLGGWPVRLLTAPANLKSKAFSLLATRERSMAEEATVGLLLWDRESFGTVTNVLRLIRLNKSALVYVAPEHTFVEVKSGDDWSRFLAYCGPKLKQRIAEEVFAGNLLLHGNETVGARVLIAGHC